MAREFKPVRFFVMMAVAAFIVCGVTAFYTHRAEHGRTAEERQAYWIGEKAGEQVPRDEKLPTPAALNTMAQKYFEKQGSGNKQDWDLAFEHGYEGRIQQDALKLAHCYSRNFAWYVADRMSSIPGNKPTRQVRHGESPLWRTKCLCYAPA